MNKFLRDDVKNYEPKFKLLTEFCKFEIVRNNKENSKNKS